jgi:hypothetical protein
MCGTIELAGALVRVWDIWFWVFLHIAGENLSGKIICDGNYLLGYLCW